MRKPGILPFLLFNSLMLACVPGAAIAAFDSPESEPAPFALANLASYPEYLAESPSGHWFIQAGGARLYSMPEVQPFSFRASGGALNGLLRLRGYGLKSGAYQETSSGLEYQHLLVISLQAGLEAQVMQVSIRDYGSAWAGQVNARLRWTSDRFSLAFTWINITASRFGSGNYPLPRRLILGGSASAFRDLALFVEVEKDSRYDLTSRLGAGYQIIRNITLLGGFQSTPDVASLGLSALIGRIRAGAAFQFHADLGFSQCYGLGVTF